MLPLVKLGHIFGHCIQKLHSIVLVFHQRNKLEKMVLCEYITVLSFAFWLLFLLSGYHNILYKAFWYDAMCQYTENWTQLSPKALHLWWLLICYASVIQFKKIENLFWLMAVMVSLQSISNAVFIYKVASWEVIK